MSKNRILVIEDDKDIADSIGLNLELSGYDYTIIDDGLEAAKRLSEDHSFDLALLDVMLPGLDGFALMEHMQKYNIQPEAWGPLSEGQKNIFCNRALDKIASKYQKSVAQIILRWNIQRNVVVIPRTINEEHLKENIDIWDFSLNDDDMKAISKLDIGYSEIINYYSACTAKVLNEVKIRK